MQVDYIKLPKLKDLNGKEILFEYPKITYAKKGKKILIVSDTTSVDEYKSKKFFFGASGEVISSAFDVAIKTEGNAPSQVLVVGSYIIKKFNSLSDKEKSEDLDSVIFRIARLINAYKPDCVVLLGNRHLNIWQNYIKFENKYDIKTLNMLRGRVLPVKIGKHSCNVVLSFSPKYVASQDYKHYKSTVNLLGFVVHDFENAIRNRNLYTIPKIKKKNTHNIMSIKDFDIFYKKLRKAKRPSFDTETDNLNRVYENRLLVILVSLDGEEAYQIPFMHPQTPFTPKELNYIKRKFRQYFEFGTSEFTIYHTSKFDILQFFAQLEVRFYNHKVYDIVSGAYGLDENRKFFKNAGYDKAYTLEFLSAENGSLAYQEGALGKQDRTNLAEQSLEDILEYGAKDVLNPFHIAHFQIAEAKRRGIDYKGFLIAVTELFGEAMTLVFADMEHNGALVDRKYIVDLMAPNSKINKELEAKKAEFKSVKSAIKVNKTLLKNKGIPIKTQGIFGKKSEDVWLFDINRQYDQQELFFKVLGLHPLGRKKDGGGQIDKKFINEYKDTVPEVKLLQEFRAINTLINTFIKGLFKSLASSPDSYVDSRLRAAYNFFLILTTRSSSSRPNLQNIPQRGPLAKIIKRMFIASRGKMVVKLDYSANEVRIWGNLAKDKLLAKAFAKGMILRREMRILRSASPELDKELDEWLNKIGWDEKDENGKPKSVEIKAKLAKKLSNRPKLKAIVDLMIENDISGDIHKVNYGFFFGVSPDKVTDEQRYSVKAVVFGVIYGKMFRALAQDIFKKELKPILQKYAQKLRDAGTDEDAKESANKWYNQKMHPYWEQSKAIINKLFEKFSNGGKWLNKVKTLGNEHLRVVSPYGAVRHLWGYLHNDNTVHGMMDRRSANSLVQGPASNIGYFGARLMRIFVWLIQQQNIDLGYKLTNYVHDALESETNIASLPVMLYFMEHAVTTAAHKRSRKVFGFPLNIGLEVEFDIGGALSRITKYDFTESSLIKILTEEIDWMNKELKYDLNKSKLIKQAVHNHRIINKFRIKELSKIHGCDASEEMLLKPEMLPKLGLKGINYKEFVK